MKHGYAYILIIIMCVMALLFTVKSARSQTISPISENPRETSSLYRVKHDAFVSYYDTKLLQPVLVFYTLEWPQFAGAVKVGSHRFKVDTKLPRPRVKDSDYQNSGYVRGHLCSAADRDSQKDLLKETYLTSNLVPMTMVCNSGKFKQMEDSCRALAISGHHLKIARGGLFGAAGAGPTDVIRKQILLRNTRQAIVIPDAFFCFATCKDCNYRGFWVIFNSDSRYPESAAGCNTFPLERFSADGTTSPRNVLQVGSAEAANVIHFMNDPRISVLLELYIGLWSREEYETITR